MKTLFLLFVSMSILASPEREVHIVESFLGSSFTGDVYYTIASVSDNQGSRYSGNNASILYRYEIQSDGMFLKTETPLSQKHFSYPNADYPGPRSITFRHFPGNIQLDDLITSSTEIQIHTSSGGLIANCLERHWGIRKEWGICSWDDIQKTYGLVKNEAAHRVNPMTQRSLNYFYANIPAASTDKAYAGRYALIHGEFIVAIPVHKVLETMEEPFPSSSPVQDKMSANPRGPLAATVRDWVETHVQDVHLPAVRSELSQ